MLAEPDLGSFLKVRRAALRPAELGLPDGLTRRRVRGLRREEVAQLAGISVDYYTRIEQGRARAISDAVLDAVARALRLTADEHAYLRNIARPRRASDPGAGPGRAQRVRPQIRQLLDALEDTVPAYVYGRATDILAWNRIGGRIVFDLPAVPQERRNSALLVFLHPRSRALHPDWAQVAEAVVAGLRAEWGRHPDDPRLRDVVGELRERSPEFRWLWQEQTVQERANGVKRVRHPEVGELLLSYETFRLPTDPDQVLCTYTAERGSPTAGRLRTLAELTAAVAATG